MDPATTPDLEEFRQRARAWLAETAPRFETQSDGSSGLSSSPEFVAHAKRWQAEKAASGWAAIHWPIEFGGLGLSRSYTAIYQEEEGHYDLPSSFFGIGLNFCAPTLMAYASQEQSQRFLPKLLTGEEIWCQLFSEPGAGSDLAGLRMRADRDGDEWVLNGQKIWTTNAQYADYAILVARHDPSLPKHKGLTYFFVDMKSDGVEPRPIKQIAGTSSFNEVFFTRVRVPDCQRMGEIGEGWQVALTTLMNERLNPSSATYPPDFRHAIRLARSVDMGGSSALDDAAVRDRLADWYVESRGLELIQERILGQLSRGEQPGPEASLRKLVAANKLQSIADFGMDLQELGGILMGPDVAASGALFQDGFLHAPGNRIAGGTDEILRNILAERVLRLPGDFRVDRDVAFSEIPTGAA